MKKLLLFVALVAFGSFQSFGQACTPDAQFTEPGIYPDSATGIPISCVDSLYAETITVIIPADTVIDIGGFPITVPIDSFVVVGFTGLPASFSYSCYDGGNTTSPVDQCAYEGGTTGCMLLTGTPTLADIGTYQLVITVDGYVGGGGTPAATEIIDWYYLTISDCASSVIELSKNAFKLYPNPATEHLTLETNTGDKIQAIQITNTAGEVVSAVNGLTVDSYEMNTSTLEAGMYFVHIDNGSTIEVLQFVKK